MAQTPLLATIRLFAGNFAPRGYALCDGQLLSIAQNTALFSLLGTTYGGDGISTFALPNLQSRVTIGPGTGTGLTNYVLGQTGGTETVALNANNLPAHSHGFSVPASTNPGNTATPGNTAVPARSTAKDGIYSTAGSNATLAPGTTSPVGSNLPFGVVPPFVAINYIIALVGVYPARS